MNPSSVLKTYFGYDSFRSGQEDIIQSILGGKDALAIMPTGAGKSICYQVPALLLPGITLVISPLISLMQDQVKSLNESGIHAAFINSSLTETQISKALNMASKGTYKIIYAAPERLESGGFLDFALNTSISMITVDEAHCISQWGQDFRPSYLKIVDFIDRLPKRPIVSAFTATATEEVKTDIECILKLREPSIVVTGFDRENLYYRVEHISGKHKDAFVTDYIEKHRDESGIIYCATRKNVDTLYENLFKQGVAVTRYHAGIDNETRKKNQDDFIYDRTPVIVATNAFGMGIDKSNVRFVIHYNMPQSMENYYQEAGRAGRDGENSQCILLFSQQDVMINKFLLEKKEFEGSDAEDMELIRQRDAQRLRLMEGYCKSTTCLRQYILSYFGEKMSRPCDNCGNCHREYTTVDMTADAKWVINCLAETRGRYGQSIVTGTLLGANRARLREIRATEYKSYGVLSHRSEREVRLLIDQMLLEGYIIQTEGEYSVLRMGDIGRLKNEDTRVAVRTFEEKRAPAKIKGGKKRSTDALTSAGYRLFEKLRSLRLVIAREEGMPPYIIFNDRTLIDMCAKIPKDKQEMLQVSGVAENKFQKYGQRFLEEIGQFTADNPGAVISAQIEDEPEAAAELPEKKQEREQDKVNQGTAWSEEEDERLSEEYLSGMKIAEIAREHGRTSGAIRARLKKNGLIV
ncbi:DNA helicase RecQ [Candidatus Merdisoma sp. JLR.KK011]|uniref:DNA helicase RecQ n=1 Tax=Candidatus Merdisoma sp. JLR.KK011 TaxID=3114299 RepID=UPI002FEF7724